MSLLTGDPFCSSSVRHSEAVCVVLSSAAGEAHPVHVDSAAVEAQSTREGQTGGSGWIPKTEGLAPHS